jgi:hypothetical protein
MRPRWEYLIIEEPNPKALQRHLADAGADGWEAVGVALAGDARFVVVMKRSSAAMSA